MQQWWIIWQLNGERLRAAEAEREQRRRWAIARADRGAERPGAMGRAWTLRLPRVALTITLQPTRSRS